MTATAPTTRALRPDPVAAVHKPRVCRLTLTLSDGRKVGVTLTRALRPSAPAESCIRATVSWASPDPDDPRAVAHLLSGRARTFRAAREEIREVGEGLVRAQRWGLSRLDELLHLVPDGR